MDVIYCCTTDEGGCIPIEMFDIYSKKALIGEIRIMDYTPMFCPGYLEW